MRDMIKSLPGQLEWAASAELDGHAMHASEVLVCGMGGSGISGDVANATNPGTRISVHKDYRLPAWAADARPLVAIASY